MKTLGTKNRKVNRQEQDAREVFELISKLKDDEKLVVKGYIMGIRATRPLLGKETSNKNIK